MSEFLSDVPSWPHPLQAVAFDLDGLLVNTEELYSEVGSTLLSRRGKIFSAALKDAMTGLPGPLAFQIMIEREQLNETAAELALESAAIFDTILEEKVRLLRGVRELIDFLGDKSIPCCVATSSSRVFATRVLRNVGLNSAMQFVVTAEDVERGKPHPDIYLEASRRLNIAIERLLVFEDSHHGSRAGVRSGACTVAVPGPHSEQHDFTGVCFRANTLADPRIYQLIESSK